MALMTCETTDKRMRSLVLAMDHRTERARLIARIRRYEVDAHDILADPPACIEAMFLFDFLRRVPGVGLGAVRDLNRRAVRAQLNLAVTLGDLKRSPYRQRWVLEQMPAGRRAYRRRGQEAAA